MKPTFKQFLEMIDVVSSDAYGEYDSDSDAANHDYEVKQQKKSKALDGKFKAFPGSFSNKDFEILHFVQGKEDTVVLVHKKKRDVAVSIRLADNKMNLFNEPFEFWSSELLSSAKEYRGQGLAVLLYQAIAKSGKYILASSSEQTAGGVKTWAKLLKVVEPDWVYAAVTLPYAKGTYESGKHLKMTKTRGENFVLIKGNLTELRRAAYDSSPHRLLIIPSNLATEFTKQTIEAK